MTRIKICGIRDSATALGAIGLGADALGFVFAESPRRVMPQQARDIILQLPPYVTKVGVFVDEDRETVQEIAHFCGLDLLQLHGQETPDYCKGLGKPVVKGIRVKDEGSLTEATPYLSMAEVSGFLLDTYRPDQPGGTGETFNWQLAVEAKAMGKPIILAGGLTVQNVSEAVQTVRPYAVDVSSGVETNGLKDREKIKQFIQQVRGSYHE